MKKATLAVHAGKRPSVNQGGVVTPVFTSSAIAYMDDTEVRYPRYLNTINSLVTAEKIARLEDAEAAIVTSSGMGAISMVMMSILNPGDHAVVLEGLYGGTHALILKELDRLGIEYSFATTSPESIAAAVKPNTRLIYIESPTNPLLNILDLEAVAEVARACGALTVIDGTFGTPILQNPISHGIDVVLHSGTKYLGGHSDLCCGAVAGSKAIIDKVRATATNYGTSLNAQDCALLERSLMTLELRVTRQCENALKIAQTLSTHPRIARVYYPGLPDHPHHAIALKQMRAFGAIVSFELAKDIDPEEYIRGLNLVFCAVSLGGVESTICQPTVSSHAKMPVEERERLGITPRLLRLSVGIEDVEDILEDILPG